MSILMIGLAAFGLFLLQLEIYKRLWAKKLGVSLSFQTEAIFEGEESCLVEVIENRKRLPLPMLKVKFQAARELHFADSKSAKVTDQYYRNDVFHIRGKERIIRSLTFTGGRRGYYGIHGIDIVGADMFMSHEMIERISCRTEIAVYPTPWASEQFNGFLQQINGEVLAKRYILEDPFEYKGIREYQPYDSMHRVNWKATARTGELKVNEKNHTSLQEIRIFLNPEDKGIIKQENLVEAAISIATGLAAFFLRQGIRTALYSNGRDILTGEQTIVRAGAGRNQMEAINRVLARLDTQKDTAPFEETMKDILMEEMGGCMTFLVALHGYDDFVRVIREYGGEGGEYRLLYPTWDKSAIRLPEEIAQYAVAIEVNAHG